MNIKPEEIELHDALIESTNIDYEKNTITLKLQYYPEPYISKNRVPATVIFSGVENYSETTDFLKLATNKFAGHINHWQAVSGRGTTYIYLCEGMLAIKAKSMAFV